MLQNGENIFWKKREIRNNKIRNEKMFGARTGRD